MTRHRTTVLAFGTARMLLTAACGGGDDNAAASARVVNVEMRDIAYSPTELTVDEGETVRLVFRNEGQVDHDGFIGDETAQADHEADMGGGDDGAMHHGVGDDNAITVEPGDEGEVTYTFDAKGTLLIGCHEPGHYAAGMTLIITVA